MAPCTPGIHDSVIHVSVAYLAETQAASGACPVTCSVSFLPPPQDGNQEDTDPPVRGVDPPLLTPLPNKPPKVDPLPCLVGLPDCCLVGLPDCCLIGLPDPAGVGAAAVLPAVSCWLATACSASAAVTHTHNVRQDMALDSFHLTGLCWAAWPCRRGCCSCLACGILVACHCMLCLCTSDAHTQCQT